MKKKIIIRVRCHKMPGHPASQISLSLPPTPAHNSPIRHPSHNPSSPLVPFISLVNYPIYLSSFPIKPTSSLLLPPPLPPPLDLPFLILPFSRSYLRRQKKFSVLIIDTDG